MENVRHTHTHIPTHPLTHSLPHTAARPGPQPHRPQHPRGREQPTGGSRGGGPGGGGPAAAAYRRAAPTCVSAILSRAAEKRPRAPRGAAYPRGGAPEVSSRGGWLSGVTSSTTALRGEARPASGDPRPAQAARSGPVRSAGMGPLGAFPLAHPCLLPCRDVASDRARSLCAAPTPHSPPVSV